MKKQSTLASLLPILELKMERELDEDNPSEFYQLWGVCLYFLYRYYKTNDVTHINKCISTFSKAISKLIAVKDVSTSLHDGLGGFYFVYQKLCKDFLIENDERLETYFLNKLKTTNANLKLDLVNGIFGNYIVTKDESYLNLASELLIQFNKELNLIIESFQKNESQIDLNYKERYLLNTGLAHGWAGKLQFITKYYPKIKKEFTRNQLLDISNDLYRHIIQLRKNNHKLQFPSFAFNNESNAKRLSWCHNDLGIAFSLLIYAKITTNKNAEAIAIEIIDRTCNLKIDDNIGIEDPFICHGSSGVALIYHQIYQITKNQKHYKQSKYWLSQSYQLYNNIESSTLDLGLLQGLSGLGIALQYIEGDIKYTDWLELIQLEI